MTITEFLDAHIEANREELLSHLQGLSDSCLVALKAFNEKNEASISETMASVHEDYGALMNSEYTMDTLLHLSSDAEETEQEEPGEE